jgi:hypothetical protein
MHKTAGGPGSGVSHPNTQPIRFLETSPLVSIGFRKKFMEDHTPIHKDIWIDWRKVKYKCQENMVPRKVVNIMINADEALKKPIDVIRDSEGFFHILDGHHRGIVAILLKRKMKANIYNPPKLSESDKTASVLAPIVHVAQNVGASKLLKSKFGRKYLTRAFSNSLQGKTPSVARAATEGFLGGALIPEASIITNEVRNMAGSLRKLLIANGASRLKGRNALLLRKLTEGNFSALSNPKLLSDPKALNVINAFSSKFRIPLKAMLKHPDAKRLLLKAEKKWKKSPSALQKNILPFVTRNPEGKISTKFRGINLGNKNIHNSPVRPKAELVGSSIGSLGLSIFDPITAGMNQSKILLSNDASRKVLSSNRFAKKILHGIDESFINHPLKKSFKDGFARKHVSRFANFTDKYIVNSAVNDAKNMSRNLGEVAFTGKSNLRRFKVKG